MFLIFGVDGCGWSSFGLFVCSFLEFYLFILVCYIIVILFCVILCEKKFGKFYFRVDYILVCNFS